MNIDKQQIVNLLRERGEHDKADRAQQQLPDQVDHEQHRGLLQQIGIDDVDDVVGKVRGLL